MNENDEAHLEQSLALVGKMPSITEKSEEITDIALVGEINEPETKTLQVFQNMSIGGLPEEASKIILKETDADLVEFKDRKTGIIYMPTVHCRARLTDAFGLAGWALQENEATINTEQEKFFFKGSLYVHGRFIAQAIGAQQYFNNNKSQDYSDAYESAKTDCLSRCCKDLSMFKELWMPHWISKWKKDYAVQAWCKSDKGEKLPLWRLYREDPFNGFYLKIKNKSGFYWTEDQQEQTKSVKTRYTTTQELSMSNPEFEKLDEFIDELGGEPVDNPQEHHEPERHKDKREEIAIKKSDKTPWLEDNSGLKWREISDKTIRFMTTGDDPKYIENRNIAARERVSRKVIKLAQKTNADMGKKIYEAALKRFNITSTEDITAENHPEINDLLKKELADIK